MEPTRPRYPTFGTRPCWLLKKFRSSLEFVGMEGSMMPQHGCRSWLADEATYLRGVFGTASEMGAVVAFRSLSQAPMEKGSELVTIWHYRKQLICRVPTALGIAQNTLDKHFAECHPRHSPHGKKIDGKEAFAEYLLSGTRQRSCQVPSLPSAKKVITTTV